MLKFGIISQVDTNKGLARVNFQDDDVVSAWLPVLQSNTLKNKFFHTFDINEHVACMMDANCENGVILGAIYSKSELPGSVKGGNIWGVQFEDGTKISYDRSANLLKIEAFKDVTVICEKATIEASDSMDITSPTININGDINLSGRIDATDDITTSGEVMAGPFNIPLSTHKHIGVTTGPGTSGTPIP